MFTLRTTKQKITILASLLLGLTLSNAIPSFAGTFAQNHPRRAQVLGRTNNLGNRIQGDRGNLGGHFGQLSREDRSIRRQEQRDARINGGFITRGQQRHLNREENRVNRQIHRDYQ